MRNRLVTTDRTGRRRRSSPQPSQPRTRTGGAHKAGDARTSEAAQRHYTAADQTLARSVVLKAADLGSASRWSGGVTAGDTTQPRSCSNFHPRQSDLVITGDAQSDYTPTTGGLEYHNEAQIMQNAKMVRLDWQRNVLDPAALSCLRTFFVKNLVGGEQLVSLAPVCRASHRDVHRRLPGSGRPVRCPQHDRRALRRARPHGDHPRDLGAVLGPGQGRAVRAAPRQAARCSRTRSLAAANGTPFHVTPRRLSFDTADRGVTRWFAPSVRRPLRQGGAGRKLG